MTRRSDPVTPTSRTEYSGLDLALDKYGGYRIVIGVLILVLDLMGYDGWKSAFIYQYSFALIQLDLLSFSCLLVLRWGWRLQVDMRFNVG